MTLFSAFFQHFSPFSILFRYDFSKVISIYLYIICQSRIFQRFTQKLIFLGKIPFLTPKSSQKPTKSRVVLQQNRGHFSDKIASN